MVSALHSLMLLSPWLIGAGGQSSPGTVASLSSHRKDLREKHVSRPEQRWSSARQVKNATSCRNTWDCAKCLPHRENLHLHVLCFGGRSPYPKDARTARRRKSTMLLLVFKFSLLNSLLQLRIMNRTFIITFYL